MEQAPADLSLSAPLDMGFLPVATGFAEQAALSLGLGRGEALKLTLASEEVFSYLCRVSPPGQRARLTARGHIYCVSLDVSFQTRQLDLRLLNLAASPSLEDEAGLDELGLLLASRSVERFSLQDQDEQGLSLSLTKEKAYPAAAEAAPPLPPELAAHSARPAQAEDLLLLAQMLAAHTAGEPCPRDFTVPGKLMDMVASGDYGAVVASDAQGNLGGAILWRSPGQASMWSRQGGSTVICYGPYVFGQPAGSDLPASLVEACLGRLAKSEALGLICTHPTSSLPREYFEKLGSLREDQGPDRQRAVYYRGLKEDPGASLWADPQVTPFLEEQYRRLAFARHLRPAAHQGQRRPEHSVLACRFNRSQGQVMLHPVWDGQDFAANLKRHLRVFREEGLDDVYCGTDLAWAWQAACAPALMELGFAPRLVLPHAGQGDLLLWQLG